MTAQDYVSQKFQGFGFHLSEADLLDISISGGIELGSEVSEDNLRAVSVAIARFIPSLLMRASSVGESGFSMSWNMDGIRAYYALLCKQHGLKDTLTPISEITFL